MREAAKGGARPCAKSGRGAMLLAVFAATAVGAWAQAPQSPAPRASTPAQVARRFETRPGQFEIVASDASAAQQTLGVAAVTWESLRAVLDLPARYPTPIIVRVVPAAEWAEPAVFRVVVEPGGVVSVRLRWEAGMDAMILRRALVQALIMRQAVTWHGVTPGLTAPLWLEHACAMWVVVRERPAMLDLWQQEAETIVPPTLPALLTWQRGEVDSRARENASYWLLVHLQAESGPGNRWPVMLRQLLNTSDPVLLLNRAYHGSFTDEQTRELWWQVGFHHHRRLRSLPLETVADSRAWLADCSRWVGSRAGRDVVFPLVELMEHRTLPWVQAELNIRLQRVQQQLGKVHPFYNNTAISLGRLYEAARDGRADDFKRAHADFLRDANDGRELEDVTAAALDRLEASRAK